MHTFQWPSIIPQRRRTPPKTKDSSEKLAAQTNSSVAFQSDLAGCIWEPLLPCVDSTLGDQIDPIGISDERKQPGSLQPGPAVLGSNRTKQGHARLGQTQDNRRAAAVIGACPRCGFLSAPAAFACESCEELLHVAAGSSRRIKANKDVASSAGSGRKSKANKDIASSAGSGRRSKANTDVASSAGSGRRNKANTDVASPAAREIEHHPIEPTCSCCSSHLTDCWTKENAEIRSQVSASCDSFQVQQVNGKGKGLIYTGRVPVPTGKILLEYTGTFSAECRRTDQSCSNEYVFQLSTGGEIDGRRDGGMASFINHGFWEEDVNCEMVEFWKEDGGCTVYCTTIRLIQPGEELLYYYSDEFDSQLRRKLGMPIQANMKPRTRTMMHCYVPISVKGVCTGRGCDKPKGHLGLCIAESSAIGVKRESRSIDHFIAEPSSKSKQEQPAHTKPKKSKVATSKAITSKANREKQAKVFTVDHILDHRPCPKDVKNQKFQYLVKWKSYSANHNSWEPEKSFLDKTLLDMYWAGKNIV